MLEVGFGGGVLLPRLLVTAAFVYGLDRSSDTLEAARREFSDSVRSGRARFNQGAVETIPLPDASFDQAITVHTIYFWRSLDDCMGLFVDFNEHARAEPHLDRSSPTWGDTCRSCGVVWPDSLGLRRLGAKRHRASADTRHEEMEPRCPRAAIKSGEQEPPEMDPFLQWEAEQKRKRKN